MKEVFCPYCGKRAEFVDSAEVYHGRSYGMIYLCRPCDAYVGCHGNGKGDSPKGRLANAELRRWKIAAHNAFDPLWKFGPFRGLRNSAYAWLAEQMGVTDMTVSRWKTNKIQPSMAQFVEIARLLQVDIKDLLEVDLGTQSKEL